MKSVEDAPELGHFIPPMPDKTRHHVVSRGQIPDFYRPEDLRDKGEGKTAWGDAFEKMLVGLYWVTNKPVPFAFRTPDGRVRSLDAGCLKMLLNRTPPDASVFCDHDGYIESVAPSQRLLELYEPMRPILEARIESATESD